MPRGDELPRSISYIPYGEIFVEESDNKGVPPYRFNAKELDEETGLYYYGARYLDPTGTTWLSVDPLFEKYVGMSPYNYCAGNPVKFLDPDGRLKVSYFSKVIRSLNDTKEHDRNLRLTEYFATIRDVNDVTIVGGHGVENGSKIRLSNPFTQKKHDYTPAEFVKYWGNLTKNKSELNEGIIVLFSCSTGKGGEKSFAADLSSEMSSEFGGGVIIAPSDDIMVNAATNVTEIKNGGRWLIFVDGKEVDSFDGKMQLNDYFNDKEYRKYIDDMGIEVVKSKKSCNEQTNK